MVWVGLVVGVLVGLLVAAWRDARFGVAYGILASAAVWATAGFVASNRADEMAGIGYAVAGGVAFWYLAVPTAVVIGVLERRDAGRRRDGRPTASTPPGDV